MVQQRVALEPPLRSALALVLAAVAVTLGLAACARGGAAPTPATTMAGKVSPPVALSLAFTEAPRVGAEANLELTVRASADLPRVAVSLRLPREVRLVSGAPSWVGALRSGEERRLAYRVEVVSPGRFDLGARAAIEDGDYAGQVAGTVIYLDASGGQVRWSRDPIAR